MTDPDDPDDWHTWLAANPPPSLQALAEYYHGYSQIPVDAWIMYDRARQDWETKRKERLTASYAGLKKRI